MAADPGLVPECRVSVGGKKLDVAVDARLARVEVDLDADLFARAELVFHDPQLELIDGPLFACGVALGVELGFGSKLGQVFQGEVVALEPRFRRDMPPALHVICQDPLHRLALSQTTRALNDVDDKQVVQKIAQEYGLSGEAPSGTSTHQLQGNVSDALLLRRIAQKHGNSVRIEGKKLILGPPPRREQIRIGPGDGLRKLQVRISSQTQVGSLSVHGWDAKQKREIVGTARPEGETGKGARDHGEGTLSFAGHQQMPPDVASAESMAQGRLRKIAEGFITAKLETLGDPRLLPGALVELEKIGAGTDGQYRVDRAIHRWSKHGYWVNAEAVRTSEKTSAQKQAEKAQRAPEPQPQREQPEPAPDPAHRISFWRVLEGAPANAQPQDVPVATALDGAVVARLHRFGQRPLPPELVSVRTPKGIAGPVTLQTGRGTADVAMREGGAGSESEKKLLFWYGDSPGDAAWDDIQLVEVSASGDAPFATTLRASAGAARGELGLLDVLAEDPDAPGTWRTLRHGVFRTRTPRLKLVLPNLRLSDVRVFLDDGDDRTDDELDLTALLRLSGPVTTVQLPGYVRLGGEVRGVTNQKSGRDRVFRAGVEQPPAEGEVALFVFGQNRLRVEKGKGSAAQKLFSSYSLHYLDRAQTVAAPDGAVEDVPTPVRGGSFFRDSLTLDFKDSAEDAGISRVLQALRMKPVSYSGRHRILEARALRPLTAAQLDSAKQQIASAGDELIEEVSRTPLLSAARGESGFQERLPAPFNGDFNAANHTFNTAAELHWHHFVLHTFSAHRLIESRILPENRPAYVSVAGAHFQTNSAFLRPTVEPEIRRIQGFDGQNPGKKIAIFGHTDSVGSEANNNQLSLRRARSMDALLRHRFGFWYDRFDQVGRPLGPGIADRQWALHELGLYNGPLDGNRNPDLDAAEAAFRAAHPGTGAGEGALRRAIADQVRARIGAVHEPIQHENRWGDAEMREMLHRLGFDGALSAAIRGFQQSRHLTADGSAGVATWVELIREYMKALLPAPLADARFHAGAVFGCGEAFPAMPLGDNRESLQNRRVEVIFRTDPVQPVNNALLGAAVPYLDWLAPEVDVSAPANTPTVVVAMTDSGIGRGAADNWGGDRLREVNDLQIRGERWVRPTRTTGAIGNGAGTAVGNAAPAVVNPDGDLRNVNDGPAAGGGSGVGHGTAVATCLGAEAPVEIRGTALGPNSAVLGTAPHVKIRPIQALGNMFAFLQALEVMAADPEVKVYTTSLLFSRIANLSAAQQRALKERAQELLMAGKLAFSAAANYNGNPIPLGGDPGVYHTSATQFGSIAGDRRNSRSTFTGANEYQQRLAVIGASKRMGLTPHPLMGPPPGNVNFGPQLNPGQFETATLFSFIGEQVALHTPGEQIRAIAPTGTTESAPPAFGTQNAAAVGAGLTIGNTDGTSFATPMTAGIAAELMLVDPALQQPANLVRVLEYLEATADPLPNLNPNAGEVWNGVLVPRVNDPTVGGNVNHPAFSNIRRTHFWKAVLAALNGGLSSEGRTNSGGKDVFFKSCDLKDDAATTWYGFELRTLFPDAVVWLRKPSGELVEASDGGALFPRNRIVGSAWICTDAYDAPQGASRFVLPAFPWNPATLTAAGRTPFFMAQLSIEKARLADFEAILLHLPSVDPRASDDPPALEIRVADRPLLRNPSAIPAAAPEAFKQAIRLHVDAFDDFVFHVTQKQRPLAGFRIVSPHRRTAINVGEEIEVLVYAVDAQGFLTNQGPANVTVTHNGGASVSFNGAVVPQAGAPVTFGVAPDPRCLARLRVRDGAAEALTLTINDGTHPAVSLALNVQSATAAQGFELTLRRRGGAALDDAHPARTGEELELEVKAVDQGRTFAGFTGEVHLAVAQGEVGSSGAQRRGVHVKNHAADPFSAAAFTHAFVAADQGVHVFPLIDFTAGALQMRAESGALSGLSQVVQVQGGAAASLRVQASTPQTVGNGFEVMVSVLDGEGNVVEDFTGTVTLSRLAGTAPVLGPPRQGVFVNETQTANDDTHDFVPSDHGIFRFRVTAWTAEAIRLRATSGALTGDSGNVQIQAAAVAPARFQVDVIGASEAGQPFSVRVTAVDGQGRRLPGFAGNVQLAVTNAGAMAPLPALNPAAHAYVAADEGAFTFTVTSQRTGSFRLQATSGALSTQSAQVNIGPAPLDHFQLQTPAAVKLNTLFPVRVTAQDQFNNTVTRFLGNVQVLRAAGGAALAAHAFAVADNGTFQFNVQLGSLGVQQLSATDQNFSNNSGNINVVP